MRYLLTALLLLLYAATAQAGVFVGFGQQSGPTLLYSEDFEGTAELSTGGWATPAGATAGNYDYTSDPLDGGQSLHLATDANQALPPAATITGDTYSFVCHVNFLSLNHGYPILRVHNGATTSLGSLIYYNGGVLGVTPSGGTRVDSSGSVITTGVSWLRVDYTTGTGANAKLQVYTSTDGATWTLRASSETGTSTLAANRVRLYGMPAGVVFDSVSVYEP